MAYFSVRGKPSSSLDLWIHSEQSSSLLLEIEGTGDNVPQNLQVGQLGVDWKSPDLSFDSALALWAIKIGLNNLDCFLIPILYMCIIINLRQPELEQHPEHTCSKKAWWKVCGTWRKTENNVATKMSEMLRLSSTVKFLRIVIKPS